MKSNKTPSTYENRVAAFERTENLKKDAATLRSKGKTPAHPDTVAKENPYLQARLKVLSEYPEGRRIEIAAMERDGNINNRFYDEFIRDVVLAAGDVPSLAIRARIMRSN